MPAALPILYSFRRCPYAIRTRMTLRYAQQRVELREVELRNKPAAMLAASSKGTVPVLVLPDGKVIEESLDIMRWALAQQDSDNWRSISEEQLSLINYNDQHFKEWLDKYKYADRHPQHSASHYRAQAEIFLAQLEIQLAHQQFLHGAGIGLADVAVFPFIRQFAFVDPRWFEQCEYNALHRWLNHILDNALFTATMNKYVPWQPGTPAIIF